MRLVHFSFDPITELRDRSGMRHDDSETYVDAKPGGLWVSDEDEAHTGWSWLEWSRAERFRLDHFAYAYEIDLVPDANILFLRTCDDIDRFTEQFAAPLYPGDTSNYRLDWEPTVKAYDGIIITPYQYDRRLHHGSSWYYTWDCASGVIWNMRAIQRPIRQIPAPDMTPEPEPGEVQIVPDPMLLTDQSDDA